MDTESDEKTRKEELRELTQFRDAIIQSANIWINTLNKEGAVTLWNEAAEEISGYTAKEVIGSDTIWEKLYPDEDYRAEVLFHVSEILGAEKAVKGFETTIITKEGTERIISWNSQVIEDSAGNLHGSVAIGRDITERKERERKLQRQNERLNEFTSIVSHDLRNPINIAQGYLELARSECDSDHLTDVEVALTRVDETVNQTLRLARHGQTIGKKETVDVALLAENCWEGVNTMCADLQVSGIPNIEADPRAIRHLFENLFRNAVEHGGEKVTVRVGPHEDGFYIEDDGIGFSDDAGTEPFDPVPSAGGETAGLGLTIVKRIVDAHNWEIQLTESADGGARFEVGNATTDHQNEQC